MASLSPTSGDGEAAAANNTEVDLSLPEYFDLIFNLQQDLDKTEESTSSDSIQGRLREGILMTEKAIRMVNDLELFSRNEEIEEVSTNEIKYMLLSAFLGYFTGLNTHLPRLQALHKSKLCFSDFLRLLKSYNVIEYDISHVEVEEGEDTEKAVTPVQARHPDLVAMSTQRNKKIERFREKKAMEKKIAELKVQVEKEYVDDEVKREFFLTLLKQWANFAIDEIDNCNMELQMLKHREEMMKGGNSGPGSDAATSSNTTKKPQPFRPFILTKSQIQKQVFGAGYPAIPTMTVDEFYEQKLKEGTLSESVQGHSMQQWAMDPEKDALEREKEAAEKEEKIERDDPETLQRARAMDDWKDEHRRGDGNRHNKG